MNPVDWRLSAFREALVLVEQATQRYGPMSQASGQDAAKRIRERMAQVMVEEYGGQVLDPSHAES